MIQAHETRRDLPARVCDHLLIDLHLTLIGNNFVVWLKYLFARGGIIKEFGWQDLGPYSFDYGAYAIGASRGPKHVPFVIQDFESKKSATECHAGRKAVTREVRSE